MMARTHLGVTLTLLFLVGIATGEDFECDSSVPKPALITSFISVDNSINGTTICRMEYMVPDGANLYQGMVAASQQHGDNFTFEYTVYDQLGHFITAMNGVEAAPNYFFGLFDEDGVATPVGADWIQLDNNSAYIWNYMEYIPSNDTDHSIMNYTGTCLAFPTDISPSMPLTYVNAFLTISNENTGNFKNGTNFKPVCKQLVLFNASQPSLYNVLMTASDQVPLQINANLRATDYSILGLNGLMNQEGYAWVPYNATTNMMLPSDLSMTDLVDGDHIVFRFTEMATTVTTEEMEEMMTTAAGQKIGVSLLLLIPMVFVRVFNI